MEAVPLEPRLDPKRVELTERELELGVRDLERLAKKQLALVVVSVVEAVTEFVVEAVVVVVVGLHPWGQIANASKQEETTFVVVVVQRSEAMHLWLPSFSVNADCFE